MFSAICREQSSANSKAKRINMHSSFNTYSFHFSTEIMPQLKEVFQALIAIAEQRNSGSFGAKS
jgi:hypothetical protein